MLHGGSGLCVPGGTIFSIYLIVIYELVAVKWLTGQAAAMAGNRQLQPSAYFCAHEEGTAERFMEGALVGLREGYED